MNILVTGSNGQLGNEIRETASRYSTHKFFFTDVEELDICDVKALQEFIRVNHIDSIINCAAYTAVDKAETDALLCYKINRDAVENIARAALSGQIKVVHVSTDYVFDGTNYMPYTEDDTVCPATVYGKSKAEGERLLREICPNSLIIRTSWLYSSFGNNFVKTMIRLGKERDELNVIFDQVGTPTYAADLAATILKVVSSNEIVAGIYHFSNEGVCSWYDFARSIHQMAGVDCKLHPIESKDYPAPTPRPHYSVLNKAKIKSVYGIEIPHWEDSLAKCVSLLK